MIRRLVAACVLSLLTVQARSADVRTKIKDVNAEGRAVTFLVEERERTLPVAKDAMIVRLVGKAKNPDLLDVEGGLKGLKPGVVATISTDKKAEGEVVTQVRLDETKKKKEKTAAPTDPKKTRKQEAKKVAKKEARKKAKKGDEAAKPDRKKKKDAADPAPAKTVK